MNPTTPRPNPIDGPQPADGLPTHDAAGVDLTLIREALAMSPAERLEALTQMMASLAQLGVVES